LLWSGDVDGAIEALETAVQLDPRLSTEDLFNLGAAYFLAGQDTEAVRTLISAHDTGAGSGLVAATLKKPPKKNTRAAMPTTIAIAPINANRRMRDLRLVVANPN